MKDEGKRENYSNYRRSIAESADTKTKKHELQCLIKTALAETEKAHRMLEAYRKKHPGELTYCIKALQDELRDTQKILRAKIGRINHGR